MKIARKDVVVLALSFAPIAVACSNTEEAAPSRTVIPGGTSTSSSGGSTDAGNADANVDPSCLSGEGCFTCEPSRSIDLLNACTGGQCAPFDNAARLPLYVAGQALPPVP